MNQSKTDLGIVHESQLPRFGITPAIKRELRRRSAVEPVIGHLNPSTAWAATISGSGAATPTMPSSPPPATTSAASSAGSGFCCAKSSALSSRSRRSIQPEIPVLHGRRLDPGSPGRCFRVAGDEAQRPDTRRCPSDPDTSSVAHRHGSADGQAYIEGRASIQSLQHRSVDSALGDGSFWRTWCGH
jgi:hypothetical protein